jgi:large subunit ribosomal protein L4
MATATTLDVLSSKGEKVGTVDLPDSIFAVETNVPLIHQVVVAQLAAARQGTHKTKNRGERSGSGVKPFKQKGTGRARQGSVRAPEHRGGGVVHGPVPRDYSQRTPKKMIAAALRGVLSDRARGSRIHVLESFGIDNKPSTKAAREVIALVAPGKRVLVVMDRADSLTEPSARNLENVHLLFQDQLNAYDVVVSDDIVFTKAAFDDFVAARAVKEVSK